MKKIVFLLSLTIIVNSYSQESNTEVELSNKIDSLRTEISGNNEKINFLQSQNMDFEKEIILTQKKIDSIAIYVNKTKLLLSQGTILYNDINHSKRVMDIPSDEEVGILAELDNQYKVQYNGQIGYAFKFGFYTEAQQSEMYKRKERMEKINLEKKEVEELEKQRIEKRNLEIEEEKQRMEQEERDRIPNMIKKYGEEKGKIIGKKKVKIGFTQQMCIDSWGKPKSINKTTTGYGVHEQWVYASGNYLFFENGILSAIQN